MIPAGQHGMIDPGHFEVIVNASAAGLGGGDGLAELPLDPGGFRSGQTVVDMVYGDDPGTLLVAAEWPGPTRLTASRSWSARAPVPSKSGPESSQTSPS